MHLELPHLDHYIDVYCNEYFPENLWAKRVSVNQIVHIMHYEGNIYVAFYNYRTYLYSFFSLHTPKLISISTGKILSSHVNIQPHCFTEDDSKRLNVLDKFTSL